MQSVRLHWLGRRNKMVKKTICSKLQSGHSAFFKRKSDAQKCKIKLDKTKGQVKVRVKKTKHTLRGKGWLVEA